MTRTEEIKTALFSRLNMLRAWNNTGPGDAGVPVPGMAALLSDALERVGDETFGLCTACEERISPKRLSAVPWAKYCVACQDMKDSFAAEIHWNSAA
jgi:hypothetical protein